MFNKIIVFTLCIFLGQNTLFTNLVWSEIGIEIQDEDLKAITKNIDKLEKPLVQLDKAFANNKKIEASIQKVKNQNGTADQYDFALQAVNAQLEQISSLVDPLEGLYVGIGKLEASFRRAAKNGNKIRLKRGEEAIKDFDDMVEGVSRIYDTAGFTPEETEQLQVALTGIKNVIQLSKVRESVFSIEEVEEISDNLLLSQATIRLYKKQLASILDSIGHGLKIGKYKESNNKLKSILRKIDSWVPTFIKEMPYLLGVLSNGPEVVASVGHINPKASNSDFRGMKFSKE